MKKKKQTLLWEIQSNKNDKPSYIFGTMHVKDSVAFHFIDQAKAKIDEVDMLANEFDFTDLPATVNNEAMTLSDQLTLDQLLTIKLYQKLDQLLRKMVGVPVQAVRNQFPLLINNLIAEKVMSAEMPTSLDQALFEYAQSKGIATGGIETYAEQVETLQKIPLKYQIKSLVWTIKNAHKYEKEIKTMKRYYELMEIDKLYQSSKRSLGGMRKILLYDRNVVMADRIAEMTRTQSVFCAIGAAHLWGKKGVLYLLKHKGFKIKPLKD